MNAVKHFVQRVRKEARPKPGCVKFGVFGQERTFYGYDWGGDTFIFESGIWKNIANRAPVLIIRKSDIAKGSHGYIFTLSSGNHGVALIPLVSGAFWTLGAVSKNKRQKIITGCILCANAVNGKLELSQRGVKCAKVVQADEWLQSFGFDLSEIIFSDRNSYILDVYRRLGQEWRVKPLAWNESEMRAALRHSRTTISSRLKYYHSSAGVHFLSYSGLRELLTLFEDDYGEFIAALKELVFVYMGQHHANMRFVKRNNHHEIELFGLHVGAAEKVVIPELENLMDLIIHKKLNPNGIRTKLIEILNLCEQSLESPALADSTSKEFIERMYFHLSGEIYYMETDSGNGFNAFDARRVALPGATYRGNRPDYHPAADNRTKVLIQNVEQLLSHEEQMEYVNVYELRNDDSAPIGSAVTREVVFKTNRRPVSVGLIEKKLALNKPGYGSYLLARVHAFISLGLDVGHYRLLSRPDSKGIRQMNFFLRDKCPGEPLQHIKPPILSLNKFDEKKLEDVRECVRALCSLLGNAAAQNLVMKKFIPALNSCRFGEGKEIFEVGFDVQSGREIPLSVMFCSVRGALGWKNTAFTSENLDDLFDFYLTKFAEVLVSFSMEYLDIVSLTECTERFLTGFEFKTKGMFWNYMTNRDAFDNFDPLLSRNYAFTKKWRFVLWSLEQQHIRIDDLKREFIAKVIKIFEKNNESDKK